MNRAVAMIAWAAVASSAGCGARDVVTTPTGPSVAGPSVASVLIAPGSVNMRVGDTMPVPLTARVRDSSERRIDGATVTWASSNTAVARVVAGSVRAVGLGTATITASSGGVTGTATVTVYTPSVATIVVTPASDTLLTEHRSDLLAITYDQVGGQYQQPVTWSTSDQAVATVESAGTSAVLSGRAIITAVAPGRALITASAGSIATQVPITIVLGPASAVIAGDWTMTLSASPSCRDNLPPAARDRQYLVHVTQQGAYFGLTISSPTLVVDYPGENGGSLVGTAITFAFVGDTGYDTWSITYLHDLLGDGTRLDFEGIVTGVVSGGVIHAAMSGDMELGPESMDGPIATCRATDHAVTLRR